MGTHTHVSSIVHADGAVEAEPPMSQLHLAPREREVVRLVIEGYSNDQIAERMQIRRQTVKNHLSRIYARCGVATRVQLAIFALREGLLD
jgi:DNA-binding NarL/FixJ family response regulator